MVKIRKFSISETYLSQKGYAIIKEGNEDCVAYLRELLTVEPKANPNMYNPEDDKSFPVYRENTKKIYIPRNLGFEIFGVPKYDTLHAGQHAENLVFTGNLRKEQMEPVNAFIEAAQDPRRRGGIISVGCGFGKTILSLYLACHFKKKTLVLCHKEFLMNQWKERIAQFIPTARVGMIKAKEITYENKDIVIASVQSICMKEYDSKVFEDFGFVACDECFPYTQKIATEAGAFEIGQLYNYWKSRMALPRVLSYNEKLNRSEYKRITYCWEKTNYSLLKISFAKTYIKCTPNHKILTPYGYIEADKLSKGDLVKSVNDNYLKIRTIQSIINMDGKVYDIEVEDNHNFVCYANGNVGPIVHNCHHLSAEVFSRALPKIIAPIMLGLSATLDRKDGLRKVFEWHLGKPVFQLKGARADLLVKLLRVPNLDPCPEYGKELVMWNGKKNCAGMINAICSWEDRTKLIMDTLENILKEEPGRRVLILSDRKGHLKIFESEIKRRKLGTTGYYVGGMKESALKESESKDIILGTYPMASEGMDIPVLNTLVLASPISSIEQSIGRVQRQKPHERKYTPLVIDVCDNFSLYTNQSRKRIEFYKKHGYKILGEVEEEEEEAPKEMNFVDSD